MSKPLGILLVDDQPQRAQMVSGQLSAAGYCLLAPLSSAEGLLFHVERRRQDIVLSLSINLSGRERPLAIHILRDRYQVMTIQLATLGDNALTLAKIKGISIQTLSPRVLCITISQPEKQPFYLNALADLQQLNQLTR